MPRSSPNSPMYVGVIIKPVTPIRAPVLPADEIALYIKKGWIADSKQARHLDRAFPRDVNGRPIILRRWIRAVLRRACRALGYPEDVVRKILDFEIVDEKGIATNYAYVYGPKPFIYTRPIFGKEGKNLSETYEYLSSVHIIAFVARVDASVVDKFVAALAYGGRYVGLMSGTKMGHGRFEIETYISTDPAKAHEFITTRIKNLLPQE